MQTQSAPAVLPAPPMPADFESTSENATSSMGQEQCTDHSGHSRHILVTVVRSILVSRTASPGDQKAFLVSVLSRDTGLVAEPASDPRELTRKLLNLLQAYTKCLQDELGGRSDADSFADLCVTTLAKEAGFASTTSVDRVRLLSSVIGCAEHFLPGTGLNDTLSRSLFTDTTCALEKAIPLCNAVNQLVVQVRKSLGDTTADADSTAMASPWRNALQNIYFDDTCSDLLSAQAALTGFALCFCDDAASKSISLIPSALGGSNPPDPFEVIFCRSSSTLEVDQSGEDRRASPLTNERWICAIAAFWALADTVAKLEYDEDTTNGAVEMRKWASAILVGMRTSGETHYKDFKYACAEFVKNLMDLLVTPINAVHRRNIYIMNTLREHRELSDVEIRTLTPQIRKAFCKMLQQRVATKVSDTEGWGAGACSILSIMNKMVERDAANSMEEAATAAWTTAVLALLRSRIKPHNLASPFPPPATTTATGAFATIDTLEAAYKFATAKAQKTLCDLQVKIKDGPVEDLQALIRPASSLNEFMLCGLANHKHVRFMGAAVVGAIKPNPSDMTHLVCTAPAFANRNLPAAKQLVNTETSPADQNLAIATLHIITMFKSFGAVEGVTDREEAYMALNLVCGISGNRVVDLNHVLIHKRQVHGRIKDKSMPIKEHELQSVRAGAPLFYFDTDAAGDAALQTLGSVLDPLQTEYFNNIIKPICIDEGTVPKQRMIEFIRKLPKNGELNKIFCDSYTGTGLADATPILVYDLRRALADSIKATRSTRFMGKLFHCLLKHHKDPWRTQLQTRSKSTPTRKRNLATRTHTPPPAPAKNAALQSNDDTSDADDEIEGLYDHTDAEAALPAAKRANSTNSVPTSLAPFDDTEPPESLTYRGHSSRHSSPTANELTRIDMLRAINDSSDMELGEFLDHGQLDDDHFLDYPTFMQDCAHAGTALMHIHQQDLHPGFLSQW